MTPETLEVIDHIPVDSSYVYITQASELAECLQDLEKFEEIAVDTETYQNPGKPATKYGFTDPFTNNVRLIQLRGVSTRSYIVDVQALGTFNLGPLQSFLERSDKLWVLHNAKFDYKMLKVNLGVSLKNVWDTMIASQLIGHACGTNFGKSRGHGLKDALKDFMGVQVNKDEQISYWGGSLSPQQLEYAANDVLHILKLKSKLSKVLTDPYPEGFDMGPATQLEMDLIPVLGDMELNGICFDPDIFKVVQAAAKQAIPGLVESICKNFGIGIQRGFMGVSPAINLESVPQLMEVLKKNGIDVESTEADVLEEASKIYPKLEDLLEYKKLKRAEKFPYDEWCHPLTRRIHPSYNQLGAGTSRLSCNDPNLQQVPKMMLKIPDKILDPVKHAAYLDKKASQKAGKDIYLVSYRACFVASEGHSFIDSDFSGQELCIVAAMSEDSAMCHALSQPEFLPDGSKNPAADLHSIAASEMFDVPVIDVMNGAVDSKGEKYRNKGKILNFSLIYGKSEEGFAKDWGVHKSEARKLLKKYFKKFAGLKAWLDKVSGRGEATRMSRFPEGFPEARWRFLNDNGKSDAGAIARGAMNTPVQGTGAIMVKKSLVRLHRELLDTPCKLVLTVHDEIGFEAPTETATMWRDKVKLTMEDVANYFLKGLVPGRSDAKVGDTWHATH